MFASAYDQLSPAERAFVDGVVREFETRSYRDGERISNNLNRPVPVHIQAKDTRGMLQKPIVGIAITERVNEIALDQDLTALRVIRETMIIANANIDDFITMGEDGTPILDIMKAPPEKRAAIKSLKIKKTGSPLMMTGEKIEIDIQLWDKLTALKMLGQHIGVFEPDNPHWRRDMAQSAAQIPADATPEAAADAYQSMLEGSG